MSFSLSKRNLFDLIIYFSIFFLSISAIIVITLMVCNVITGGYFLFIPIGLATLVSIISIVFAFEKTIAFFINLFKKKEIEDISFDNSEIDFVIDSENEVSTDKVNIDKTNGNSETILKDLNTKLIPTLPNNVISSNVDDSLRDQTVDSVNEDQILNVIDK